MASRKQSFFAVVTCLDDKGETANVKTIKVEYFGKVAVEAIMKNQRTTSSILIPLEVAEVPSAEKIDIPAPSVVETSSDVTGE